MILTAQTLAQIVNQIYLERDVKECAVMYGSFMAADIMQELALYLLEKPEEKIKQIYNRGELKYYVISMIQNMAFSPTSQFQRKFFKDRIYMSDLTNNYNYNIQKADEENKVTIQEQKEIVYNRAKASLEAAELSDKKKYIYNSIFNLYFNSNLSIRKIAKLTHISYISIFKYLKEIKQIIKDSNIQDPRAND